MREIACKKIGIDTRDGWKEFSVNGYYTNSYKISHITVIPEVKLVMIRDNDNLIKFFSYTIIEFEPIENYQKGTNAKNIVYNY